MNFLKDDEQEDRVTPTIRDKVIYDSGSTVHLFNSIDWFEQDDFVAGDDHNGMILAGDQRYIPKGKGTVKLHVVSPVQKKMNLLVLKDAIFIPGFHINIVSMMRCRESGIVWNQINDTLITKMGKGIPLARLRVQDDQWIIASRMPQMINAVSRRPRPPNRSEADLWHRRFGHMRPEAFEQLTARSLGMKIVGPKSYECEVCATGKAHQQISRVPADNLPEGPGLVLTVDIHCGPGCDLKDGNGKGGYNGHKYWILFTCRTTSMRFIYTVKPKDEIRGAFTKLVNFLNVHYNIRPNDHLGRC